MKPPSEPTTSPPGSAALSARIETVSRLTGQMAFVWLSNGDKGYRLTMPVDLAEALVEALTNA